MRKTIINLLASATLAFCSWDAAIAEERARAPASDTDIRQMLSMRVEQQHQATGVVVGIVEPDGAHFVSYGTVAQNDPRPMNADTIFDVGSITKVVTSLLLADMAVRGELSLDDPVARYLPAARVTLPSYEGRSITFTDLATHTSGLPLRPTNLRSTDSDNKYSGYTLDDLYAFLSGYKLMRPIGSAYEYSNVGYGLIGAALSHRGNASWADLVRNRITDPLGMRDTRVELTTSMKERVAAGYTLDTASLTLSPAQHWDMGALESAGALRSSARDLTKFLMAALDAKQSQLSRAFDLSLKTRRPGGMQPANEIALGWNILRNNNAEIAWKNGSVGGFRAFIGFDRSSRRGVIALANAQTGNGVDDIGLHLLDATLPIDTHIPRAHKEIVLAADVLERYVGRYRFSETDVIEIVRDGSQLFCFLGPDKLPLFPESDRDFFLKVADIQLTFDNIENGRATKVIWHQDGQDQVGSRASE